MLKPDLTSDAEFPADANVKISIAGLSYSQLTPELSKVKFLSDVPGHQLEVVVKKMRRDLTAEEILLDTLIDPGNTISVKADNSITPGSIEAVGDYPLSETVFINELHDGNLVEIMPVPADAVPIILSLTDCAFYTEQLTSSEYEFIEVDGDEDGEIVTEPKRIGFVIGGKIKSGLEGNIYITIAGPQETEIISPLSDEEGEFIYQLSFNNHCMNLEECRGGIIDNSDFHFYYDVLIDSVNPGKEFKLVRSSSAFKGGPSPRSVDQAACNPVVQEPPKP